jgi:hypothetical protein
MESTYEKEVRIQCQSSPSLEFPHFSKKALKRLTLRVFSVNIVIARHEVPWQSSIATFFWIASLRSQ